jgi:formylglycine-generating enzyme required for sulfatase activity
MQSPSKLAQIALLLAHLPLWSQAPTWQAGVAQVIAKDRSPGTGFIVSLRGGRAYLVTSAHVVEGDPSPSVVFAADADRNRYPAQVRDVEGGEPRGLALLSVEKPPGGLRAIDSGPDSSVSAGTSVIVAGFPRSIGAFSVLPANVTSVRGRDLYLSPETGEGFSGGPVMLDGRVIGLVYGREGGFGKAVPVASIEPYLRGHEIAWRTEPVKPVDLPKPQPASQLKPGEVRTNPRDGQPYVWIPPGEFQMGCSPADNECDAEEKPPHTVRITRGFWLGQTEVTQVAYQKIMRGNASKFKGTQHPVERVDWDQARKYCEAVGGRLPTEAEWEYAARAGSTGARYGDLDAIAWYAGNSGKQTHPVKQKQPNSWGLYDMLGNVKEWVADWYEEKYYQGLSSPAIDPKGPDSGTVRVVRGYSWLFGPRVVRASVRSRHVPSDWLDDIGFRCAREVIP